MLPQNIDPQADRHMHFSANNKRAITTKKGIHKANHKKRQTKASRLLNPIKYKAIEILKRLETVGSPKSDKKAFEQSSKA
jgi:hypothetical protein|tara:strand:+ start:96 stop:335 length:240 start_codon:yes stop_codon:yes gene_type:complete